MYELKAMVGLQLLEMLQKYAHLNMIIYTHTQLRLTASCKLHVKKMVKTEIQWTIH